MALKKLYNSSVISEENESDGLEESTTNLIVNYLPQTMSQLEMHSIFSSVGEVESCKLIKESVPVPVGVFGSSLVREQNLGYGFVNYHRPEDAEKAIKTLNGLRLENKTLKVSYARPRSEAIKNANLYISGLPRNTTQQDLEALFSPYGSIITSRILRDNENGIGFVRFHQRSEGERAIQKLHNTIPLGSTGPLTVKFANSRGNYCKATLPYTSHLTATSTSRFAGSIRHPMAISMLPEHAMDGFGTDIFVYNLASEAQEVVLWQLFGPFGAVRRVSIIRDLLTKKCKGFGFVTMTKLDEAVVAIQSLNGSVLGGRVLQVSFKTNKARTA